MALTFHTPQVDHGEAAVKSLLADRRIYLASDERTIVDAGDPAARFLLVAKGARISSADVARLGLSMVDGRVVQERSAKAAPPDADKQHSPDGDKMAAPQGEKSASTGKREKR